MLPEVHLNIRTFLSTILTAALMLPMPAWTQQTSTPPSNLVQETGTLKVVVVEGEGAVNKIKSRSATQPVVEVRDESDKPVAGAEVVFQLPAAGPGGVFNGWMRTQTARSDAQGRAVASGMTPNDQEGRFNIKVTASEGRKTGTAIIAQTNSPSGEITKGSRSHKKLYIVLGVLVVGAIAGGVAATHTGGSEAAVTPTNPVTVAPGPVTVGAPR
jgi:hypothetical protein